MRITPYFIETSTSSPVLYFGPRPPSPQPHLRSHNLPLPKVPLKSVFSAPHGLRAEGRQRQVHLWFALYSSANPTYVNHQGPVGEKHCQISLINESPSKAGGVCSQCLCLRKATDVAPLFRFVKWELSTVVWICQASEETEQWRWRTAEHCVQSCIVTCNTTSKYLTTLQKREQRLTDSCNWKDSIDLCVVFFFFSHASGSKMWQYHMLCVSTPLWCTMQHLMLHHGSMKPSDYEFDIFLYDWHVYLQVDV